MGPRLDTSGRQLVGEMASGDAPWRELQANWAEREQISSRRRHRAALETGEGEKEHGGRLDGDRGDLPSAIRYRSQQAERVSELMRQTADSGRHALPRMALRYRTGSRAVELLPPRRGRLSRRPKPIPCDLIDLSIDGALVALPVDAAVCPGYRLALTIDAEQATAGVRHVQADSDGQLRCGLAFRTTTPRFDALVNETIAAVVTDPRRNEAWRIS